MFRTAWLHLGPGINTTLMVDTEAGQPGDGLSLDQLLQTDGTLATVFTEHVRIVWEWRGGKATQKVILDSPSGERLGAEWTADIAMPAVDSVEADPGLRHGPLVEAPDPGGPGWDTAARSVSVPGESLREGAVSHAARLPSSSRLVVLILRGLWAEASFISRPHVAGVIRRRGWAEARGEAVEVLGASVSAGLRSRHVRVAALLRAAPTGLRVLEAPGELHHQTGGPGAAGSPVRLPRRSIFPESRRGSRRFFL